MKNVPFLLSFCILNLATFVAKCLNYVERFAGIFRGLESECEHGKKKSGSISIGLKLGGWVKNSRGRHNRRNRQQVRDDKGNYLVPINVSRIYSTLLVLPSSSFLPCGDPFMYPASAERDRERKERIVNLIPFVEANSIALRSL